jgi:alpha-amylase
MILLTACKEDIKNTSEPEDQMNWLEDESGVYYQVFVRSFADSDGDGIGDFNGLTSKLDYLKDLGIKGIWLMPFNPSDSYHGYDVKDYYNVNPDYGTMEEFENFVNEAHKREIKIIMDLVINHTSKNHPWFISASSDEDSEYRDYYHWASASDSRIDKVNADGNKLWHQQGDAFYASYFPGNYADLNYLNPKVEEEVIDIGEFWMEKGVNGFRLDAALHLFAQYKVPKQYDYLDGIRFWNKFRQALRETDPNVYLVGEVWDDSAVYATFYNGFDSTFNFDLSDFLVEAAFNGNMSNYPYKINMIYKKIEDVSDPFRDSPFLRNHDQERIASYYNNDIDKLKLVAEMLLTLPGNPYIYYGEEIGMNGVKSSGEQSGVWDETLRQPFAWGDESITPDWMDEACGKPGVNCSQPNQSLKVQESSDNSLFNTYKDMIQLRNEQSALSFGEFAVYDGPNAYIQGFLRYDDEQLLLVLHNFSNTERDLPIIEDATLIYESKGETSYQDGKIAATSTLILELPYEQLNDYITE